MPTMDDRLKTILQSLLLNVDLLNGEIRRLQGAGSALSPECVMLLKQLQESYVRGLREVERLTIA